MVTVASSAADAQPLDEEQTAHSTFQILIPVDQNSILKISVESSLADDSRRTNPFLSDEIVMSHRPNLETEDRTLLIFTRSKLSICGKTVLLVSDFRRILLPALSESRPQIVDACSKRS